MAQTFNFKQPKTLKECMQLLASLHDNHDVKKKVMGMIKGKVEGYCNTASRYIKNLINEKSDGYLYLMFAFVHTTFTSILQIKNYGDYGTLTSQYAEEYTDTIATILPQCFATLYFLYFKVSSTCKHIKGGGWENDNVTGTSLHQNDLFKWLRDEAGQTSGIISRGFGDNVLKPSTPGSRLAIFLKELLQHTQAKALQHILCGLLFISDLSNNVTREALCGHSCLFLWEFCIKVDGSALNNYLERYSNSGFQLKLSCKAVKQNLKPLITGTFGLQAVCEHNQNMYDSIWDNSKSGKYLKWFHDHLRSVETSLASMLSDSGNWDETNLKSASSAGPFKYGFVFKDGWETTLKSQLKPAIDKVIKSLHSLLIALIEPRNLKDCLQLFTMLNVIHSLRSQVLGKLKDQVQKYCNYNSTYVTQFLATDGHFCNMFSKADSTVFMFIQSDTRGSVNYGHYRHLQNANHDKCDCVDGICRFLGKYLPQVCVAVYFLYFSVDGIQSIGGGGNWKKDKLNEPRTELVKWLKDQIGQDSDLMPRGFDKDELHRSNAGNNLVTALNRFVDHNNSGHLQNTLLGILFICEWDHCKTAYAVLFIQEFCNQVHGSVLQGQLQSYDDEGVNLKGVCIAIKTNLQSFMQSNVLSPVCQQYATLYKCLVDESKFQDYVDWLMTHLNYIIASLKQMSEDSKHWTNDNFRNAKTHGPFKYGFVFKYGWQSARNELSGLIAKLTGSGHGSLHSLLVALLEPKTLKDCLQLMAKAHNRKDLGSKVFRQFKGDVENYSDTTYLEKLVTYNDSSGYLHMTFQSADWIITTLLGRASYGSYNHLDECTSHTNCIKNIVTVLSRKLFRVFAAFYFLYYQVSWECRDIHGGQWNNHRLSQSSKTLYQWLTDQAGQSAGIIKRGFKGSELQPSTSGQTLAKTLEDLVHQQNAASLQKVLLGMLFICPTWVDALSGYACLFLWEFCLKISGHTENHFESKFSGLQLSGNYNKFKELCGDLKISLDSFVGFSASSGLCAVCWDNQGLYRDIWNPATMDEDKFEKYLIWFKENLDSIKRSLDQMKSDINDWSDPSKLSNGESVGPFKYGFVFRDPWNAKRPRSKLLFLAAKLTSEVLVIVIALSGELPKVIMDITDAVVETIFPSDVAKIAGGSAAGAGVVGTAGTAAYTYTTQGASTSMYTHLDEWIPREFRAPTGRNFLGLNCTLQ